MRQLRILTQWTKFREACFPDGGAPTIQLQEMRRSFYAGASAAMAELCNSMDTTTNKVTKQEEAAVDEILEELKAYIAAMEETRQ